MVKKKFFAYFADLEKLKNPIFLTKKPHFLGFLRVNKDLDEVLGPPSFTHGVPGYEKVTIKGARVISKGARVISECQGMPG